MTSLLAVARPGDRRLDRLITAIENAGYDVTVVSRVAEAEHRARAAPVAAVLFDASFADGEAVARVRRADPGQVLVAWTAGSSSAAAADLLESGVDEVVHPSMSEREMVARVIAALRRRGRRTSAPIELGALRVDPLHGEAIWDGRDLALTRREREVLEVLAEHAGRTVRREVLYRCVWGYAMARGERSVDVNVKRLRRKLALVTGSQLAIKTQPGVGYRLELVRGTLREPVTAL